MGKLKYFEVRFTNRSRLYHAGENLTGQVLLDLKESMQIQAVVVSVYGKPSVRTLTGTGPGCCSTVFSEAEAITEGAIIFPYAPILEGSDTVLENGFHTLNFSIPLPSHLPSSFESKHSKVQYYVLAEVEMGAAKVIREKVKATFKVINTLDLQMLPDIQMSVEQRAHVALSMNPLTGQAGHVDVVFRVDKGGYVPGERVKIFGEITNDSSLQVRKSYVELIQVITLRSNGKLKTVRNPVTGLRHHSIPVGETDVWDTDCLTVPELPPSSLNLNTGLITVSYCLQLVIIPGCLYQKVKVPINVIIGTGMTPPPAYDGPSQGELVPRSRVHSLPLRDLSANQMDIINTEGGRISLALVTPPPYIPYNEPPPPYEETAESSS